MVEDADALRKLARSFFVDHGFEVITASNGEEAVEVARSHSGRIDLLLTDVVMPGMNGRLLADRLLSKRPGLKVVFIAGHGVLEPGTHLLHKPFTEDALIRKIREVLDANRQQVQPQGNEQPQTDLRAMQKI